MKKELSSIFAGLLGRRKEDNTDIGLDIPFHGILSDEKISALERITGYDIDRPGIYERAMMHRSFLQVKAELNLESNERLEFLGDAVLDMIISDYLFTAHEKLPEGTLSKLRSNIVNKDTLVECARKLGLDSILIMSYGAENAMQQGSSSMLADAMEALIAAVYLDKGYRQVESFVIEKFIPLASGYISRASQNYKSQLQEQLQADSNPAPTYKLLEKKGPDHQKIFVVQAFSGEKPLAKGTGENKQKAEQDAARNSLEQLQER